MQVVTLDLMPTKKDCLEAVELLRKAVESGEIIAFAAVGISDSDGTTLYTGSSKTLSLLRMQGACAGLAEWSLDPAGSKYQRV